MVIHYNQASLIAVKVQSNEKLITEITKVAKTGCFLPSQDRRYLIMGRTVFPVLTESLDTNKCRKDEKSVNRQGRHSVLVFGLFICLKENKCSYSIRTEGT